MFEDTGSTGIATKSQPEELATSEGRAGGCTGTIEYYGSTREP